MFLLFLEISDWHESAEKNEKNLQCCRQGAERFFYSDAQRICGALMGQKRKTILIFCVLVIITLQVFSLPLLSKQATMAVSFCAPSLFF